MATSARRSRVALARSPTGCVPTLQACSTPVCQIAASGPTTVRALAADDAVDDPVDALRRRDRHVRVGGDLGGSAGWRSAGTRAGRDQREHETQDERGAKRRSSRRFYRAGGGVWGQTGLTSSVRQIGPPRNIGPSALTNAGASPCRIQTCVSGGCLPTSGAIRPVSAADVDLDDVVGGAAAGGPGRERLVARGGDLQLDQARLRRVGDHRQRSPAGRRGVRSSAASA